MVISRHEAERNAAVVQSAQDDNLQSAEATTKHQLTFSLNAFRTRVKPVHFHKGDIPLTMTTSR